MQISSTQLAAGQGKRKLVTVRQHSNSDNLDLVNTLSFKVISTKFKD